MQGLTISGVPYCLLTDGWWLEDAPGRSGGGIPPGPTIGRRRTLGLWLLAALVLWADVLFWQHRPGLSVALFALALMAAATLMCDRPVRAGRAWTLGLISLLPVVETLSLLSLLVAVVGLLCFAVLLLLPASSSGARLMAAMARFALRTSWFSAWAAATGLPEAGGAVAGSFSPTRIARAWALPVAAGLLFLLLFADANPLLSDILSRSLAFDWLTGEQIARALFWFLTAYLSWPFLALDRIGLPLVSAETNVASAPWARPALINPASVSNSLVLFNLMFAAQSASDILYLWSGAALPGGMTLAAYAHRGAYPLVVTALMAGLFALIARPFIQDNRRLLALLGLWLGQNGLLVGSALYRLDLYVDAYGLTYLRIAAFIWMGLVAGGLGLIFWQIARWKDNGWLVTRTAAMTVVVLYACTFVNFADMIARKNVALYLQDTTRGLDCQYLSTLGEFARPAVRDHWLAVETECLSFDFLDPGPHGWRDWGFRSWRLGRY